MDLEDITGDEDKAKEFIKNIVNKDKIALISHIDLDGLASAKIINQIISPNILKFLGYNELTNELYLELKEKKINKIIFTDLSFKQGGLVKELEEFAEILIIDHHQFDIDFNSDKTIFLNAQGYCAAYICYKLFKDNHKVKKLDWLVALACTADWMYFKNQKWMEKTYKKYSDVFNINNPRKGKLYEIVDIIDLSAVYWKEDLKKVYEAIGKDINKLKDLKKYSEIIKDEIKIEKEKFGKERKEINGGWFFEIKSKHSILQRLSSEISLLNIHKIFIVALLRNGKYRISTRRQDKEINLAKYLQKLIKGFEDSDAGGHIPAAGCFFPEKYLPEFKKRLKQINIEEFKIK